MKTHNNQHKNIEAIGLAVVCFACVYRSPGFFAFVCRHLNVVIQWTYCCNILCTWCVLFFSSCLRGKSARMHVDPRTYPTTPSNIFIQAALQSCLKKPSKLGALLLSVFCLAELPPKTQETDRLVLLHLLGLAQVFFGVSMIFAARLNRLTTLIQRPPTKRFLFV